MWGDCGYKRASDEHVYDKSTVEVSPVKMMDDVQSFSMGDDHVMALKKDGSVWVWGGNYCGQIGDGTSEQRYAPVCIDIPEN